MLKNILKGLTLLSILVVTWILLLVKKSGTFLGQPTNFGYSLNRDHVTTARIETAGTPEPRTCQIHKRKAVVIFTTTRSGSTFLGEFFNQHSEIYYLFEPLHGIGHGEQQAATRKIVIEDVLKCNYSRIPEIYRKSKGDDSVRCESNICFAGRMEFLWRNSELCVGKKPYCDVEVFNPTTLEMICRQSIFTAIKTVASDNLSELEPILLDPELELKVIQLVRDPRATIPSKVKMNNASNRIDGVSKYACKFFSRNSEYTKRCILPSQGANISNSCNETVRAAWEGNFMRLSHEYLSLFPFEALRAVYKFVGINYDLSVVKWLERNTGIKANHPGRRKRSLLPSDFYSTKRNSSAIVNAWRLSENFSTVSRMQEYCQDAMKDLGYLVATNEEHLKNIQSNLFDLERTLILK